jgi:hypothetical protein
MPWLWSAGGGRAYPAGWGWRAALLAEDVEAADAAGEPLRACASLELVLEQE